MTHEELITEIHQEIVKSETTPALACVFRVLAKRLPECATSDGLRILDQIDFARWLRELAKEAEK